MEHISGSFGFDRFTDAIILSLNQKETILNKVECDNRNLQFSSTPGIVKILWCQVT